MLWIKEVELVDSVDELKFSSSIRSLSMPNFEILDARIASALNRIIHSAHFKRRIGLEEQKAQKEDRFLRGRQIAHLIYEQLRVTGSHNSVENYTDLFTIVLRNDDIQEFDSQWDGILLSTTKIPPDDILEGLYKLRIRESEKLKTVLQLYDLETHQKELGPDYHRFKAMVTLSDNFSMPVSELVDNRSGKPEEIQVNKIPKPNKKETTTGQGNPCDSEIPEWLQEFREILVDDEIPKQGESHVSSSHEVSAEPITKRREDLGKHSVYNNISPKIEISRLGNGPKLQGPGVSRAKTKLHKKPKEACRCSWNPRRNQSFTPSIPWNSAKLVKIFPRIIARLHHTDRRLMVLPKEQCAE